MVFRVLDKNGKEINKIVADPDFISVYSLATGNSCELVPEENADCYIPAPSEMEKLRADVDFLAALGGVEL